MPLTTTKGNASRTVRDAEAQKQVRINEAEAEVARFNAMYEEYVKNPTVTKLRMFYETMEDVLPEMKIVIDNGDGTQKVLPLDSFTGESTGEETVDAQQPETGAEPENAQSQTTDAAVQGGE